MHTPPPAPNFEQLLGDARHITTQALGEVSLAGGCAPVEALGRISEAGSQFDQAIAMLAPFSSGLQPVPDRADRLGHGDKNSTPRRAVVAVLAEHGRALAGSARLATIAHIHRLYDPTDYNHADNLWAAETARRRDQHFSLAHRILRMAGLPSAPEAVANAVAGMQHERIRGRALHVVPWIGRAACSVVRSGLAHGSVSEFAWGLWSVRSQAAAENAALFNRHL